MLQRHRPFSGPLQQKHGRAACCRPRQLRHGCSSRPAPGACRRRLAIVAVLDGWAQPAIVGSSDSAATAEKQQQQQQLQAPLQQPSSSAPASGSSQQQQLQQQLDAAAESGGSSSASSSSSSSTGIHAQEQQPEQQQQQQQQPSWESWCAHFEQQDLQGSRLDALAAPLAAAVAAENYAAAAAIKAEADELAAADAVAAVRAELAAALAQERYAAAAVLRDEGWALLEGWWACVSPQHPLGHLLRIHPEYGRWTGKVLRAAAVWELQGWPDGEWGSLLGRSSSSSSSRRPRSSRSSSRGGSRGIDPEALAQIGTPLLEVFVKREQQQQQQQQQFSSQAVLLQPASSDAADAAAIAAAARDMGLEAEIGELFRAEVARAVWGRAAVDGDAAAAAAASLANGRKGSSSSSSNTGKERLKPLLRGARAAAAAKDRPPLSPFAAAAAGASYESLFADVAAAAAASQDDAAAFAAAAAVGGDADAAAAAAAAELDPWEVLLDAAEPALAAAAAAADADGGVACPDGVTRLIQRGSTAAQLQLPVLQLLLEVVDGSSSVLLAARAVSRTNSSSSDADHTTHGTAWGVSDMPLGPAFVSDWSAVPAAELESRQARLAASLEAQRLVRDMLGAPEGWWMTEFIGDWSPPAAAAADRRQEQQQDAQEGQADETHEDIDWQLPLHLLQQQQEWQLRQQELTPEQRRQQQQGDMTLLEETVEEEEGEDSWPVLGDDVSREGFYAGFYQDYGPGVQGPAGLVQPSGSAAYAGGFEQQAAAAAAAAAGLPADMAPAELDEALATLAELKSLSQPGSSSTAAKDDNEPRIEWRAPANSQQQQQQQDPSQQQQQLASRGSRRHASSQAANGSSSSSNDSSSGASWTPATWLSPGPAVAAAAAAVDGEELERHAATITMLGRDCFTIKPTQPLAGAAAATSKPSSSSSSSAAPRRSVFVIEVPTSLLQQPEQQQQQQQGSTSAAAGNVQEQLPAGSLSISSRGYSRTWQLAAQQVLLQHAALTPSSSAAAATPAAAAPATANFSSGSAGALPITWRQPLADLMAARAEELLWGSSAAAAAASALSTLEEDAAAAGAAAAADGSADRHSSSCSLGVAEDAPLLVLQLPSDLVEGTLAAVAGSSSNGSSSSSSSSSSEGAAAAAFAPPAEEGLIYRRIHTQQHPSDELQGLFLGTFGQHGPEVLSLQRSISFDTGEPELLALKLTGDPNVPAGEVSFRVRIGRRHRRDGRGAYPPQLDVKARYPGEGRIASPGFTNQRWVEGELLVFGSSSSSGSSSSVTNGAQLGFVWSVPGEKRFLILLNRITLEP